MQKKVPGKFVSPNDLLIKLYIDKIIAIDYNH